MKITAERLRTLLVYDPETGAFTRKKSGGGCFAGSEAGTTNQRYRRVNLDGTLYYLHRLAFLYMTGEWPQHHVDHINGDGRDNRWANLRDVTVMVNLQNLRQARRSSTVGLLGVERNHKGFQARIRVGERRYSLGTYDTPEAAHAAYLTAKRELHEGNTL